MAMATMLWRLVIIKIISQGLSQAAFAFKQCHQLANAGYFLALFINKILVQSDTEFRYIRVGLEHLINISYTFSLKYNQL